jgi:hypothetical protein
VTKTIVLEVSHPLKPGGRIEGFRFLWGVYVNGCRSDTHCQRCVYGRVVPGFSATTDSVGTPILLDEMDRYPYVYICGVSAGPNRLRGERNLHLPLEYADGETVATTTYNGFTLRAQNARTVPIPPLPDNWNTGSCAATPAARTSSSPWQASGTRRGCGGKPPRPSTD